MDAIKRKRAQISQQRARRRIQKLFAAEESNSVDDIQLHDDVHDSDMSDMLENNANDCVAEYSFAPVLLRIFMSLKAFIFFCFMFSATAKAFHKTNEIQVKRGKEDVTTSVKGEVGKQLEIFLSNAATRLKRKSTQ